MHARNEYDYWYPASCEVYSEETDEDDNEYIALNYNDFIEYQNHYDSQWPPGDESPDEDYEFDRQNLTRQDDSGHQQCSSSGSTSNSGGLGKHSCLKQKDGYYYLDPSVYDTRVMRNLTATDDRYPRQSYSPEFVQAALEKTKSFTSWSDDVEVEDFQDYDDQENLGENYYHYSKPRGSQRIIFEPPGNSGLKRMVENLIYNTRVVIFSKTYCPYCVTAKEIFEELDEPYALLELDERDDREEIQEIVGELTGGTSVPRVFVNGYYIGGGNDVKALYESGELEEMLNVG
ncbi:uncharacterized protein LOC105690101 [Athalia rosae]|uniref:uncharacterized protein LOC105690101 n=1 Tax=Athalia rosae TaxID=37344 RepID=UPI0020338329|nr:uncharacterized protein LOC105690101 [Athalia rosae]